MSDKGLIKTFNIPYAVGPLAISIMSLANWAGSRGAWSRRSCVAPFPELSLAAATCKPFLNLSFALEAGDVLNFGARAVGADLPFIFPDLLGSKGILGGFSAMRHSSSSLCHFKEPHYRSKPTLHLRNWNCYNCLRSTAFVRGKERFG